MYYINITDAKKDNKNMAHVMLNEVTDMLEDDLQPIEQYDYIALDELQPMEQGLEQYQGEEVQRGQYCKIL